MMGPLPDKAVEPIVQGSYNDLLVTDFSFCSRLETGDGDAFLFGLDIFEFNWTGSKARREGVSEPRSRAASDVS